MASYSIHRRNNKIQLLIKKMRADTERENKNKERRNIVNKLIFHCRST